MSPGSGSPSLSRRKKQSRSLLASAAYQHPHPQPRPHPKHSWLQPARDAPHWTDIQQPDFHIRISWKKCGHQRNSETGVCPRASEPGTRRLQVFPRRDTLAFFPT